MSAIMQYLERKKRIQESIETEIPAKCHICGKEGAVLFVATSSDRWVRWRPAYKKERRKYCCSGCARLYPPSKALAIVTNDKAALKHLPVKDKSGNWLPEVKEVQLRLQPQWYPMHYLGDKLIVARLTKIVHREDCQIIELEPRKGQTWPIDEHMRMFGQIFTTAPSWYQFVPSFIGKVIAFRSYIDNNDRPRVTIIYRQEMADRYDIDLSMEERSGN